MSDLSNAEILNRWKQCHSSGRKQAADYWYDFMAKRAKRGGKDAEDAKQRVAKMDRLK